MSRSRLIIDRPGAWAHQVSAGPARGLASIAPFRRGGSYPHGSYRPHELARKSEIAYSGKLACDVGSLLGSSTPALAQLIGLSGHVYAFERAPQHVAELRRTLIANRSTQMSGVTQDVGARSGTVVLEEWSNDAMTRVVTGKPTPWGLRYVQVPMTTLDDWASRTSGLGRLDLIKLDTEGQELAVLQGAGEVLARYRPHIICEVHRRSDVPYEPDEIVAWLRKADYEVRLIPVSQRANDTLQEAISRLKAAKQPTGWMAVAHVLASPRTG